MKALILATALAASPAMAQENCTGLADAYAVLSKMGMQRAISATTQSGRNIEMWHIPDTGAWVMFYVDPVGLACSIATGDKFARYIAEPNI
jgi:hypothetical protein